MASTTNYRCRCGRVFSIYTPKRVLFRLVDSGLSDVDLAEIDAQEEADGEIELARHVAEMIGATFIDSRLQLLSSCPGCGAPIMDVLARLREQVRSVPGAAGALGVGLSGDVGGALMREGAGRVAGVLRKGEPQSFDEFRRMMRQIAVKGYRDYGRGFVLVDLDLEKLLYMSVDCVPESGTELRRLVETYDPAGEYILAHVDAGDVAVHYELCPLSGAPE